MEVLEEATKLSQTKEQKSKDKIAELEKEIEDLKRSHEVEIVREAAKKIQGEKYLEMKEFIDCMVSYLEKMQDLPPVDNREKTPEETVPRDG